MTDVLFIIALVVAAFGIPGVLPWLQAKAKPKAIAAPINPRSLVPPPSPSGVVRPRPPGLSPIPQLSIPNLGELRDRTKADLAVALGNQSSSALWANVNAARARSLGMTDLASMMEDMAVAEAQGVLTPCQRHELHDIKFRIDVLEADRESPPAPPPRSRLD